MSILMLSRSVLVLSPGMTSSDVEEVSGSFWSYFLCNVSSTRCMSSGSPL